MTKALKRFLRVMVLSMALLIVPILSACEDDSHVHIYQNGICTECHDGAVACVEANGKVLYYKTLVEAVESVESATGESTKSGDISKPTKISLLKNSNGKGITIDGNRQIHFDFKGNTYTLTSSGVNSIEQSILSGFEIEKGSKVIFENGKIKDGSRPVSTLVSSFSDTQFVDFTLDGTNVDQSKKSSTVLLCGYGNSHFTGSSTILASTCNAGVELKYSSNEKYRDGVSLVFDQNYTGNVDGLIKYGKDSAVEDVNWTEKANIVIQNGNFNDIRAVVGDNIKANIKIAGGKFKGNVSKYCDESYNCVIQSDGTYKISKVNDHVCYMETASLKKYCKSIEEAMATLLGSNTDITITLTENIEAKAFELSNGKSVTLNLNGFTYTVLEKSEDKDNGFNITNGSKLILKNGSLNTKVETSTLINNSGEVKLEDVNINGENAEIVFLNSGAGTITGNTNIRSKESKTAIKVAGDNQNIVLRFDNSFKGTINGKVEKDDGEALKLLIMGGIFDADIRKYCEDAYSAKQDLTTGLYTVSKVENANVYIVNAEGVKDYYTDLADAVAAVESEEQTTIYLFNSIDGKGVRVEREQNIVFDFQGNSYNVSSDMAGSEGSKNSGFQLLGKSNITLKNGTLTCSVDGCQSLINNYSNLTLDNFNVDGINSAMDIGGLTLSCRYGSTVVTGNSNITADNLSYAVHAYYGLFGSYDSGLSITFDNNFTGSVIGNLLYEKNTNRVEGDEWVQKTKLKIENGNFDFDKIITTNNVKANLNISGGAFKIDISRYCADLYNCKLDSNTNKFVVVTVDDDVTNYVEIDGIKVYFRTLEESLEQILEGETAKIKLISNLTGKSFVVDNNKNIELDLNGYTYTIDDSTGIIVEHGSSLKLISSKIDIANLAEVSGTLTSSSEIATLLVNNGTVEIDNVNLNGINTNTVFENNATAKLSGQSNISAKDGMVALRLNGDDENVKLTIDQNYTGIVDGTIEKDDAEKSVLLISGGTFKENVGKYCEFLYESVLDSESSLYTVSKATYATTYIEREGIKYYYETPELALNTITSSDLTTIHLVTDLDRQGPRIRDNKNIVIDLNGFEYRIANNNAIRIDANSSLVLKNGTVSVRRANISTLIKNNGNLTLENVIVRGANTYNNVTYSSTSLIAMEAGTLNVLGGCEMYAAEDKSIFSVTGGEILISGGKFNRDVSAHCAYSYNCNKIEEDLYEVVKVENLVADINFGGYTRCYSSMSSALEEVKGTATLTLYNDVNCSGINLVETNLILNLNTYALTTSGAFVVENGSTLKIENGKMVAAIGAEHLILNNGALEINNVELDGTNSSGAVLQMNNSAKVTGATSVIAGADKTALKVSGDDENIVVVFDSEFAGVVKGSIVKDKNEKSILLTLAGSYSVDISRYCQYLYQGVLNETTQLYVVTEVKNKLVYIEVDGVKQYYATPEDALADVKADEHTTIVAISDLGRKGFTVPSNKNIVFDLNGHEFLVQTSTIKIEGGATFKNGSIGVRKANVGALINVFGSVVLEDVTISCENTNFSTTAEAAIGIYKGTVISKGDTIISAATDGVAIKVYYDADSGEDLEVVSEGNTVLNGKIYYDADASVDGWNEKAKITLKSGDYTITGIENVKNVPLNIVVSGGTYNLDITPYCAEGYECVDNGDGSYTVKEKTI